MIELEKPFTEEVKWALFAMERAKVPGLDGFTMHFYQECWDIIEEDLVKVFLEFYERGILSTAMKSTFIVLIPKIERAKKKGIIAL